jgi:acylpyruvate hydrolase
MKLVTFSDNKSSRIGVFLERGTRHVVLDLSQAEPQLPTAMLQFLELGGPALAVARRASANAVESHMIPESQVRLLAPIPRPGKIICVGLNYKDHAEEGGRAIPEYPTIFSKYANTVIGSGDPILIPRVSSKIDFEVELAVVIGKKARYVEEKDAFNYVAGYTILNDVTARDFQRLTSQWTVGKSFDTFAPMGPALVTRDEVADPENLDISLKLNGQTMQSSNTSKLIFSIPHLIRFLTQGITLEPGDIISTGTPAGVGVFRDNPIFLKPGDEVKLNIQSIGELTNPVIAEPA